MLFFQKGRPLKGTIYDDFCTIRIIDIAKVRANKTILSKSKVEMTLICPGEITESHTEVDKIYAKESKRVLAMQMFTSQIKGFFTFRKTKTNF